MNKSVLPLSLEKKNYNNFPRQGIFGENFLDCAYSIYEDFNKFWLSFRRGFYPRDSITDETKVVKITWRWHDLSESEFQEIKAFHEINYKKLSADYGLYKRSWCIEVIIRFWGRRTVPVCLVVPDDFSKVQPTSFPRLTHFVSRRNLPQWGEIFGTPTQLTIIKYCWSASSSII